MYRTPVDQQKTCFMYCLNEYWWFSTLINSSSTWLGSWDVQLQQQFLPYICGILYNTCLISSKEMKSNIQLFPSKTFLTFQLFFLPVFLMPKATDPFQGSAMCHHHYVTIYNQSKCFIQRRRRHKCLWSLYSATENSVWCSRTGSGQPKEHVLHTYI